MKIKTRDDARQVIESVTAEQPVSYYVPTLPGTVTFARRDGELTRTKASEDSTRTVKLVPDTAARALYLDRRFFNAQQNHTARQE